MLYRPVHLYIHIFTHETIIGHPEDLPDYVPILKREYNKDYTSEYIDLGEIFFLDNDIKMVNSYPSINLPIGYTARINEGTIYVAKAVSSEKSLLERFINWLFK